MDRDHDAVWATICDHPPVGHMLKLYAPERWVRFSGLPEGRRYPETADDYDELLYRADVLVGELCQPGDELMLVTGLYGRRGAPPPPEPSSAQHLVQPDGRYWCTVEATRGSDEDDVVGGGGVGGGVGGGGPGGAAGATGAAGGVLDETLWPLHLWVDWRVYGPRALDTAVRLVADDELAEVIVVVPDRLVAVHPYYGGVDVVFPTAEEAAATRQRHRGWASPPGPPPPPRR